MTKLHLCTLSIGDEYNHYSSILIHSAIKWFVDVEKITIVTDNVEYFDDLKKRIDYPTLNIVNFENGEKAPIILKGWFNFNLKRIAFREATKASDYGEIIAWLDCDTVLVNKRITQFKEDLKKINETSCIATRPARIGDLKKDDNQLGRRKRELYDLKSTTKYDDGHCINEQVLIFKYTDRIHVFLNKWDKLAMICDNSDINAHVEGIEIGMSLVEAGIKPFFPSSLLSLAFYSNKTGKFFSYGH